MKKLILLFTITSGSLFATNDTVTIKTEPVPTNVEVVAVYDESGREVPFNTIGFTIVLLSDNTVRKFYRAY
jgi:hypothetical protein